MEEATGNLVDLFSHRMPMGIAIFDDHLVLRRCNPTWIAYIEAISPVVEDDIRGVSLPNLLPESAALIVPYAHRALAGETVVENALRLSAQDAVFYWDTAFTPVVTDGDITGFSLVATDVTNQVLTRQLLERHVADRTRKLSALYDVMAVAAEPLPLKQILHQSLTRVLTAVQANAGLIQLLDSSGEHLYLATQLHMPPAVVQTLHAVPATDPLFGHLVADWTPLVIKDVSRSPLAPPAIRRSELRAYAGLQMNARGSVVGVLSVFRERKRPYSQEDIALLDSVADQIGVAVENARLRKENEQLLVLEER
ncbi:MAG: GAF domain-containing protein, partial [Anaerolineales bacterium]|nr:GAF domain-containing protein [Anaerolineales bacterium]